MKEVVVFTAVITAILLTCTHGLPWIEARIVPYENGQPTEKGHFWFRVAVWAIVSFIFWAVL